MQILRRLKVPTGDILVVQGEYGKLEMLSIGDYGKEVNLKADFMGLGRTPGPVRHGNLLPLEEKWVITISTQYGCSIWCQFCDVPRVGPGRNATYLDICDQVATGISLHPEIRHTKRLSVHFARMGEPRFNFDVIDAAHRGLGVSSRGVHHDATMQRWACPIHRQVENFQERAMSRGRRTATLDQLDR